MPQTIDISPSQKIDWLNDPQSWADVARLHGVQPKTIERDRIALGRLDEPINDDLLEWIRRMRRWCELGQGGGPFTRRNFMRLKANGTLEDKLKQLKI